MNWQTFLYLSPLFVVIDHVIGHHSSVSNWPSPLGHILLILFILYWYWTWEDYSTFHNFSRPFKSLIFGWYHFSSLLRLNFYLCLLFNLDKYCLFLWLEFLKLLVSLDLVFLGWAFSPTRRCCGLDPGKPMLMQPWPLVAVPSCRSWLNHAHIMNLHYQRHHRHLDANNRY